MAKSKQKDVVVDESKIEAELIKEFGDGIFRSGANMLNSPKKVIPLSPALDVISNGGIAEGSWCIVSGKAKSGKSTLALAFARNCQLANKKVFYLNVEGRLKNYNLLGTTNLDPAKIQIISSTKGNILTAEKWLNIAERIIRDEPGCLLIFDSTSALCAESEMVSDSNGQMRSQGPKLLGQFCRKMGSVVMVNDVIVFVIQHLYTNTSGKGPAFVEDGGVKIFYQADHKIRCQYTEQWKIGNSDDGRNIGQKIHWQLITSSQGGIPNSTCTGYLRYGMGIDDLQEYIEVAGSLGIWLKKAGSWYSFEGTDGEVKVQGGEKLYDHFSNNEEDYKKLREHVASVFASQ